MVICGKGRDKMLIGKIKGVKECLNSLTPIFLIFFLFINRMNLGFL
jgi:hypothetical protein